MELDTASIATIATSITSAVAVIIPLVKSNSSLQHRLKKIEAHQLILGRDMKRLIVHDEKCTIEERINAGKEYLDMGGNGSTSVYLKTLMDRYQEACEEREEGAS